ncbi:unnamed protein product [Echinostoma caproni]|uniref:Secreted protein n=1 Tax=Echinostoma caproni TaxID=27848 RepID=A0A183AJZ2_9TREM|nr:unnamed protein product [Echinostoma caproni]
MKSKIVKFLVITFCVSVVVDTEAESCEPVIASNDVKSVVVRGSVSGCQYRVSSDSGKAVKVYVNATSGTKCVNVASGGTSEKLCPLSTNNQLISQDAIEVSADLEATTAQTAATEPSTAQTTTSKQESGKDPKPPNESKGEKEKTGKGDSQPPDGEGEGSQEKQPPEGSNEEMVKESLKSPKEPEQHPKNPDEIVAAPNKLIRSVRDSSNTDVTVYYVLGEYCKPAKLLYKAQRIADRLFKEKCAAAET